MTNARETCTKPDLLPCPFCGSANIDPEEWSSGDGHGPGCSDCGACADTLERWNSRRPVNREDAVAALGALLVHLPENWGDCIRDGEMRLTVDENAIESALEAIAEGNPNLRRSVVMSYELALHLLRNPYGHSDDLVRQARLWAADRIEAASRHQSGTNEAKCPECGGSGWIFHGNDQSHWCHRCHNTGKIQAECHQVGRELVKLDEFHWHEAMDRASMAMEIFNEHVAEHPAVEQTPELAKLAEEASAVLYKVYNAISLIRFPDSRHVACTKSGA